MAKARLSKKARKVPVNKLRWDCDPSVFQHDSSADVKPSTEMVGQDRALKAITMGGTIPGPGFNIFVTGYSGTGKQTAVRLVLESLMPEKPDLRDRLYVFNFNEPDLPRLITLSAGKGAQFKTDIDELVAYMKQNVQRLFEEEAFRRQRDVIVQKYSQMEKELVGEFDKKISERGFTLGQIQTGMFSRPDILPVIEDKPVPIENLEGMVEEGELTLAKMKEIRETYDSFKGEFSDILRQSRELGRAAGKELEEFERQAIRSLVDETIEEIRKRYPVDAVSAYLDEFLAYILDNVVIFKEEKEGSKSPLPFPMPSRQSQEDPFLPLQVNLVLDNSHTESCPLITESHPTYNNLFGVIEKTVTGGGYLKTDFTKIRAGSLLRADGGYIVLNALDVLMETGVWPTLKRTLKNNTLEIQGLDAYLLLSASAIKPAPIDIKVKVVLIGDPYMYHLLNEYDDDFRKIFKVRADFDTEMKLSRTNISRFMEVIARACESEEFLPCDRSGMARLVEFGVRRAGRKGRLTTQFSAAADIAREANYWGRAEKAEKITAAHVEKAIDEYKDRHRLPEEKLQQMIDDNVLLIDTDGETVGQVNGLSVYDFGVYAFGRPTRITASVSVGRAGVTNIEREAKLSGKIYDKGMLILTGYLRKLFGQRRSVSLTASIAFEQSYSGVEGDSASMAELYALLSAISEIPVRQDIAVTGSMNQQGEAQAIGGVNEKIEGFFDVCMSRGLTGKQGVIIPEANVEDLMLRRDVVEACRKRKFNVWSISRVEEGVPLLMGKPAGAPGAKGKYTRNSVYAVVDARFKAIEDILDGNGSGEEKESEKKSKKGKSKKGGRKKDRRKKKPKKKPGKKKKARKGS
ncbi:MAG: ATP-binding protein [Planctomycetota bacterium]|nr:MAG: ATP-binding protein [Planctomycetota bacterium]